MVGAEVKISLVSLNQHQTGGFAVQALPGRCIDELDVEAGGYEVDASLLRVEDTTTSETLHSHLLRSCCPVTGQPDWASVVIDYEGDKIDEAGLLCYLISFRNNQEFHEQCVERIFTDISSRCAPTRLSVYARYTRRGGIDINPYRSTESVTQENLRLVRQ